MNPHEGQVLLAHAGRTVSLVFDWRAIAAIQEEWGEAYGDRVARAVNNRRIVDLHQMVARGSGMRAEEVMEWSPPIIEASKAVSMAWSLAWVGPKAVAEAEAMADLENPRNALPILSSLLSKVRSALASVGQSSGGLPLTPQDASSEAKLSGDARNLN